MNVELIHALSIISVISVGTIILSPLLCWVISHKPNPATN